MNYGANTSPLDCSWRLDPEESDQEKELRVISELEELRIQAYTSVCVLESIRDLVTTHYGIDPKDFWGWAKKGPDTPKEKPNPVQVVAERLG